MYGRFTFEEVLVAQVQTYIIHAAVGGYFWATKIIVNNGYYHFSEYKQTADLTIHSYGPLLGRFLLTWTNSAENLVKNL